MTTSISRITHFLKHYLRHITLRIILSKNIIIRPKFKPVLYVYGNVSKFKHHGQTTKLLVVYTSFWFYETKDHLERFAVVNSYSSHITHRFALQEKKRKAREKIA